jgi:hypothetical protein
MGNWMRQLGVDPFPTLLSAGDEALAYFVRRDLVVCLPPGGFRLVEDLV